MSFKERAGKRRIKLAVPVDKPRLDDSGMTFLGLLTMTIDLKRLFPSRTSQGRVIL
jgi:hypothetical protein